MSADKLALERIEILRAVVERMLVSTDQERRANNMNEAFISTARRASDGKIGLPGFRDPSQHLYLDHPLHDPLPRTLDESDEE